MTLLVVRMIEEQFHRDVEGRPIREGRTPAEYLREGDIEYRTCPYEGSRHMHANPMNVSALRQMGAHWDAMIDVLAALRALHDAELRVTQPSTMDIWRVSQLASALPWFYLFRDAAIPAYAAALAKATQGMGIWAQRVFVKILVERWSPPVFSAENVLALAEENGTLIGDTEVCSGGDKMLLKFFDVLVTQTPSPGRLDAPREEVLRFGAHYAGLKLFVWIYNLCRRFLYADVGEEGLRKRGAEPPDFFIIEPGNPAAVIPEQRVGWFRSLADLIVPFAPGRADLALRDLAFEMANAMGQARPAAATFAALDEIFGRAVGVVEAGLRGSSETIEVPEDIRDRLIGPEVRKVFSNAAGG